jgi:hypothetical protein
MASRTITISFRVDHRRAARSVSDMLRSLRNPPAADQRPDESDPAPGDN